MRRLKQCPKLKKEGLLYEYIKNTLYNGLLSHCFGKIFYDIYFIWWGSKCHPIPVKVRGQLPGTRSLLPPYGSPGMNSGHQAWWQSPLPTKPFCWPQLVFLRHLCGSWQFYSWVSTCIQLVLSVPQPLDEFHVPRLLPAYVAKAGLEL